VDAPNTGVSKWERRIKRGNVFAQPPKGPGGAPHRPPTRGGKSENGAKVVSCRGKKGGGKREEKRQAKTRPFVGCLCILLPVTRRFFPASRSVKRMEWWISQRVISWK